MDLRKLLQSNTGRWMQEMRRPNCDHESLADRIQTSLADEGYVVSQEEVLALVKRLSNSCTDKDLVEGLVTLVES